MKTRRRLWIAGIVVGVMLSLSPLFGLAGSILTTVHSIKMLDKAGISDPTTLSHHIGNSLIYSAAGLFICPLGIAVLLLSIVYFRKTQSPIAAGDASEDSDDGLIL